MEQRNGHSIYLCRLCGTHDESTLYVRVYGPEGIRRRLAPLILEWFRIEIQESPHRPAFICLKCTGKIEYFCDFKDEIDQVQPELQEQFSHDEIKCDTTSGSATVITTPPSPPPPPPPTNNNTTEKNLNPPPATSVVANSVPSHHQTPESDKTTEKPRRKLRNLRRPRSPSENENPRTPRASPASPLKKRCLRSRNSNVTANPQNSPPSLTEKTSIAGRLRSRNDSKKSKPIPKTPENSEMLQIPTSALNKVLTVVSGSPNMEVSVKEAKNRKGDIEDISFTLELRRKKCESKFVTVLAKVFPDQGSCLVGSSIVDLLENENNPEVDKIVSTIATGRKKNSAGITKIAELEEMEKRLSTNQNPEELFRVDGEEIRVDDNVEHVTIDNQTGYSCKLCRKVYERKDKCTVHVKTHLGIKQFACTLCCAKFVCKSDVMKHIRCSHTNPRPMQCPKCPKRFRSKFDLTEHDNVHKGIKPYQCNDCGQSYHHKVSLQMHIKSHLPPQNLACEYCGKIFPFRTRLLSHIGSVHLKNRRNFRCRFCYNLYSSLAVLNDHIKTRHATTYTCEICSKTFKVASKYKAHVLQHSNPKPFVCNVCNNRYASKAFLNEHLLKHEGLRKHICQKCGASFAQASHLAAHRHVHGEKKHECAECGKKFNRRDNMKVHMKRHFEKSGKTDKAISNASAKDTNANEKLNDETLSYDGSNKTKRQEDMRQVPIAKDNLFLR